MAAVPGTCSHQCEIRSASPWGQSYCTESMLIQCLCHPGTAAIPRYSAGNWEGAAQLWQPVSFLPRMCCALCCPVPWTSIRSLSSKGMTGKRKHLFSSTLRFSFLLCFNSTSRVFPSILISLLSLPPGWTVRPALPGCQGGAVTVQLWLGSSWLLHHHYSPCLSACICQPVSSTLSNSSPVLVFHFNLHLTLCSHL